VRLSGARLTSLLAILVLGSLGCLQTTIAGVGVGGTSGGNGSTGGRSTTGGGSTTGPSCVGVVCGAFYACDPTDGLCKCGGQVCNSGNCDPSGACSAGCEGTTGTLTIPGSSGPGSALTLPPAYLNEFYSYDLSPACAGLANVVWIPCLLTDGGPVCTDMARLKLPPGLTLFSNGQIQGIALEAGWETISYEFLVGAFFGSPNDDTNDGGVFQNVLMTVERDAGPPQ